MSSPESLRAAILAAYRAPEAGAVAMLRAALALTDEQRTRIGAEALRLAAAVRVHSAGSLGAEAFLRRYSLSTHEGVVLMCLAEALLRIPDDATADALIRDKLAGTRWEAGDEDGLLVNAASWGLMLTGKLAEWRESEGGPRPVLKKLVARAGEPVVRSAIRHAVQIMAGQFVAGETVDEALERADRDRWRYSFDMLGEAARTARDAEAYLEAYRRAIAAVGERAGRGPMEERPGISIKLSALHPRFETAKRERLGAELLPRLLALCETAAAAGIPVTLDAEEADRLLPSLELFERLARAPSLTGWSGLGLAVQAYQKRAPAVCRWIEALAADTGRRIMVRLVKGAYWDTEIKQAQVQGASDYPVFTRKAATDVSFMACAQALLGAGPRVYAQFATHNCHSAAFILECAGERRDFEFQKLHGMGDALHELLVSERRVPSRVYAPVGSHRDLLAYLVRRLLENGANTSFVHQVSDPAIPLEKLAADPLALLPDPYVPAARVPLPRRLYPDRLNSAGMDLSDPAVLARLEERIRRDRAAAGADGGAPVMEPAERARRVGAVTLSGAADVDAMARAAMDAWRSWDARGAHARAAILERAAELIEQAYDELVSLVVREAGRTPADAASEAREAADYCRYYAARARADFGRPLELPGPTGESNRLELAGRGVFACISPWNFPLAIFTGQVAAALAAGNAVVAKPAEQTPLTARRAVDLLHEAGVPREALHLAIGDGEAVGAPLVSHPAIAGVAFTGSYETAKAIERAIAARDGPLAVLVAETGGLNAMVVDSSALPEQVVADALVSAFNSAGQRCSSLRILLVQEEAAPRIIEMLAGAMQELRVGDPARTDTDVGPVIDEASRQALETHAAAMERAGTLIARAPLAPECSAGTFFAPLAFELELQWLPRREVFGPILHVVRYKASDLEAALDAIAATGYGLTLGIHSRLDGFVERVRKHLRVGNTYVNRNMIGAVVGVQPFGGEGLSGTGPKAGGPHTLHRFAVERTVTVNTAAVGGNTDLYREESG
jgi:RHH-type proline utilization regulon transcriptional repressor/proline dehydrogenase/delta 1-pyrroline-5-carboxylate dehydrogenase